MLYFHQKEMLYFPNDKDFFECKNFEVDEIKEYKNTRFYEVSWQTNDVIIYFHWNAWSACDRIWLLDILKKTNNNIIFVEYSWYSNINNNPNIKDILSNVDDIWGYINSSKYENIYVMWRSLWTWPASYYAENFKTDKLILVSAYSELYKIAQSKFPIFPVKLLFTENYKSEDYLKKYNNEILMIHWKVDDVIPYKFWLELYNWLNNNKKRLITKNYWTHHNIFKYEDVVEQIIKFFKN